MKLDLACALLVGFGTSLLVLGHAIAGGATLAAGFLAGTLAVFVSK